MSPNQPLLKCFEYFTKVDMKDHDLHKTARRHVLQALGHD